jgi:hypothetical protein
MNHLTRRGLLAGGAAGTTLVAARAGGISDPGSQAAPAPFGPVTIQPHDPRYAEVVRGHNLRWAGHPDFVRLVGTRFTDTSRALATNIPKPLR